jgi:hypothetical protein
LTYIVGLHVTWSADDIVRALEHALEYHAYDARAVERILEARFHPRTLAEQIASSTRARIQNVMRDHPVVQRSLASYQTLRTGDTPRASPNEEPGHEQEAPPSQDPDPSQEGST